MLCNAWRGTWSHALEAAAIVRIRHGGDHTACRAPGGIRTGPLQHDPDVLGFHLAHGSTDSRVSGCLGNCMCGGVGRVSHITCVGLLSQGVFVCGLCQA